MLKLNKKGFMLIEIILASVIATIALVGLFTTISKLLIQSNNRKGYSTVDAIYTAKLLSKNYDFYNDEYDFTKENSAEYSELPIDNNNEYGITKAYVIRNSKQSFDKFLEEKDDNSDFVKYVKFLSNNLEFGEGHSITVYSKILILEMNNNDSLEYGFYYIRNVEVKAEKSYVGNRYDVPHPPEIPDLLEVTNSPTLKPVIYDETINKWKIISEYDEDWYDYDNQKWANAVLLDNESQKVEGDTLDLETDVLGMYVWIPRFSYTIGCHISCDMNAEYDLENSETFCSSDKCLGYKIKGADDLELLSPENTTKNVSTPGAIDIKFINKETIDTITISRPVYQYNKSDAEEIRKEKISNWMTHPAFWWDKDGDGDIAEDGSENLSGIWVSKFDVGILEKSNSACFNSPSVSNCASDSKTWARSKKAPYTEEWYRSLPNALVLPHHFEVDMHFVAKNMQLWQVVDRGDLHVLKNTEWSAVAYLSQSKYGKYGNTNYSGEEKVIYPNDSSRSITGRSCGNYKNSTSSKDGTYTYDGLLTSDSSQRDVLKGTGASTTGNIYGIYDMSGHWETVMMGYYVRDTRVNKIYYNSSYDSSYPKNFVVGQALSEMGSIRFPNAISWNEQKVKHEQEGPYKRGYNGIFSIKNIGTRITASPKVDGFHVAILNDN